MRHRAACQVFEEVGSGTVSNECGGALATVSPICLYSMTQRRPMAASALERTSSATWWDFSKGKSPSTITSMNDTPTLNDTGIPSTTIRTPFHSSQGTTTCSTVRVRISAPSPRVSVQSILVDISSILLPVIVPLDDLTSPYIDVPHRV